MASTCERAESYRSENKIAQTHIGAEIAPTVQIAIDTDRCCPNDSVGKLKVVVKRYYFRAQRPPRCLARLSVDAVVTALATLGDIGPPALVAPGCP